MSLCLYLSHTGTQYNAPIEEIPSPEALKQWIASNVEVPTGRQILMTVQGKNVKQQHLIDGSQFFIYDKRLLLGDGAHTIPDEDPFDIPTLTDPPSELENETSLPAWQHLFKARRAWAFQAVDIVRDLSSNSAQLSDECENIDKSTNVALDNLKNHVSSLQSLFEKTAAWARETVQEHADMLKEWRRMSETLQELPIRDDVARLMTTTSSDGSQPDVNGTMRTLLQWKSLEQADHSLQSSSKAFRSQIDDLTKAMEQLQKDSHSTSTQLQIDWPNLETDSLVQEAETMAKKIDGDYNDVLRAVPDTKAILKISRVAAGHTNGLLPGLQELVQESIQVFQSARQHRKTMSETCFKVLRDISKIQSILAGLQGRVSSLALNEDGQKALEALDHVFRLPSAYGNILIEAIRRSEWSERTVSDFKILKDEISQHKDDELRRRRKWTNGMTSFLNPDAVGTSAGTVSDFTFDTPSNPWPLVSREEIFAYIEDLRALEINDAVEQITQQLRELDSPAKSRTRVRPRPFKNGNIHDAMSNSSMSNRNTGGNGDDLRALLDDKSRLEDKLRASESRIRKLEDVVHRQSQSQANTMRPPSGLFTPIAASEFERPPGSPGLDSTHKSNPVNMSSRRSSVSTHVRRLSNQTPEEKAMVLRITNLEGQILKLQQEAEDEKRSSETHLKSAQEAESIKGDLMANFEAQRQEFDDERQRLEDDNHDLKIRLEELEEEFDRVVESRDHERGRQEQAINHFRSELERLRKTSNEEIERIREAKESFERDLSTQHEKHANLESQLHKLRDERSSLQNRNIGLANELRKMESQQIDIIGTLQSVHEQLSPAGSAPDDLRRLAGALEVLAEGSTIHARGLDDALQLATAQCKASEERIEYLEQQLSKSQFAKKELDTKTNETSEALKQAQHTNETLRIERENERKQIEHLRAQFAAGETGSDALRTRLAEEEQKAVNLMNAKDKSDVQVEILQQNATMLREEIASLNSIQEAARLCLEGRERKAKELSERLFQHNDRMVRMLENFGYSVSREGSGLLIQRASKVNASQVLSGTESMGTPMKRQISGSVPAQHFTDPSDAQTLYWTTSDGDGKAEDMKYQSFITALSRLDIDSTIELITKRYKDVESFAKKYQRDSRLNREKTHRLQSEAHEKIAYRGFKEGDLALFLPTRNQATKPWAAFNVGAPHYFLREQDVHRLQTRDWLLARINKVEERVVDLGRSLTSANASTKANADVGSDGASFQSAEENDNPFELSDGLRWYFIDAVEEKPGAPSTPGLGKSTVAASVIEVKAQIGRKAAGAGGKDEGKGGPSISAVNAAKTLHKSLDSRRSSEASRKSTNIAATREGTGAHLPQLRTNTSNSSAVAPLTTTGTDGEVEVMKSPSHQGSSVRPSDADIRQARAREDDRIFDVASSRHPPVGGWSTSGSNPNIASPARSVKDKGGRTESPSKQDSHSKQGKGWDKLFSFQFAA